MNSMTTGKSRQDRGFSLTELLVALAIMSLVSLGLGSVFIEQMKTMKNIDLIVAIENDFNMMSKTARTPFEVGRRLGLKVEVSGKWVDNPVPNLLARCLQGQGTSCRSAFDAWAPLPDAAGFLNSQSQRSGPCPTPALCEYERSTQFRAECDAVRCHSLTLLVRIAPLNSALFRERRNEVRLNPAVVLNRRDIDFTCGGASGYVTAVDFRNLRAQCGAVGGAGPTALPISLSNSLYPVQPGHACPNGATSCKAVITSERSCGAGFASLSLFGGACL